MRFVVFCFSFFLSFHFITFVYNIYDMSFHSCAPTVPILNNAIWTQQRETDSSSSWKEFKCKTIFSIKYTHPQTSLCITHFWRNKKEKKRKTRRRLPLHKIIKIIFSQIDYVRFHISINFRFSDLCEITTCQMFDHAPANRNPYTNLHIRNSLRKWILCSNIVLIFFSPK